MMKMLRKYTDKFLEKAAMDNYSDGLQARSPPFYGLGIIYIDYLILI